jgi:hypothetical protein
MKKGWSLATLAKVSVVSLAFVLLFASFALAQDSFKIHNTAGVKIVQVLVSEDGSTWGEFNIGAGIEAGATAELVWADHTDDQDCSQFFMAKFADGSESKPVKFDFCQKGLTLEF